MDKDICVVEIEEHKREGKRWWVVHTEDNDSYYVWEPSVAEAIAEGGQYRATIREGQFPRIIAVRPLHEAQSDWQMVKWEEWVMEVVKAIRELREEVAEAVRAAGALNRTLELIKGLLKEGRE